LLELLHAFIVSTRLGDAREKLLANGIQFNEHLSGDGTVIFEHACRLGLEGSVSKHREHPYRSGPSKSWLKTKNPNSPAMLRLEDGSCE
jgi:bifunctional non-homologous end joining protein LigD